MRLLKLIAFLLLTISATLAKAQLIEWKANRPLTWRDFQGKPDYTDHWAAVTYSYLVYSYNYEVKDSVYTIKFGIQSIFDPQKSWMKRAYANEDYILRHEQLHFDITEVFARKLAVAVRSTTFTRNHKAEIRAMFNKYSAARAALQRRYDYESAHSNNTTMQDQWELYISLLLKNLPPPND